MNFVHPGILAGLALASLPIIIHLLNRRRFRRLEWAAMDFLLKAAVRNRRRVRMENLLLLLLRTLMVALLVLAVARPFTRKGEALASIFGAEGAVERVILLDDSHSMRAGAGNRSAFEAAKTAARSLLTRLHDGRSPDRVTLLLGTKPRGGDETVTRVGVAGGNYRRIVDRLDAMRAGDGVLDLEGCVDALLDLPREETGRMVLHVLSDFRRRDWNGADGGPDPRAVAALRRFSERGEVRLVDVGSEPPDNLSVVALAPLERAVVAGVPATFVATVRNRGPGTAANVPVTFRFGERVGLAKRIDATLQPGEETQVLHEFTFAAEGPAVVAAEIPTDALPGDDARRLVVDVRRRMRFLLVDGEPSPEPYRGETDYLAAALAAPGAAPSGIEVEVVPEHGFSGKELDSFDGVFLCNVYRLPDDRIAALEAYVRAGGGLVFFVGDQVDPEIWNAAFYGKGEMAGKRLLPLMLGELEGSADELQHFAPPAADHPVVRFLRGMNEIVLRTVSAQRFLRCEAPREGARTILSWSDPMNSPALAEKGFGEGRVLLFTTAADMEWSNFPLSPLYLAILQETARYAIRPDSGRETRDVPAPIEMPYDATKMRREASLLLPAELGGSPVDLTLHEEADGRLSFRYDRAHAAGVYLLRGTSPDGQPLTRPHVRNLDASEGDLRRAEMSRFLKELPEATLERAEEGIAGDDPERDRSEFWRPLVRVLLLFALVETLLAWRFGHHARRREEQRAGKQVLER